MVEPPVSYSYLESTVPAAACEVAISVESAGRACSARRVSSSSPSIPWPLQNNELLCGDHTFLVGIPGVGGGKTLGEVGSAFDPE
jgi:hypothetical protein